MKHILKHVIIKLVVAVVTPVVLSNCAHTVADIVPAARGTQTGGIKVDALTSVSTESRIAPVCTGTCSPSRSSLVSQAWGTTGDGIIVRTHRESTARLTVDGVRSAGAAAFGAAGVTGQLRSNIDIDNSSRSAAEANARAASNSQGGSLPWDCSDPDGNGYCYP